ncbi:MAG: rod shape-determining protein MreC [Synergistaceae bacterium]|jgi:rod shape-determining protein MreC|nr:rod shape-determining protein MreC [Synergistaceae bacterium]
MQGKLNPIFVNFMLAVFCGLMLIWFFHSSVQSTRSAADNINNLLYYPEFPARELRLLVQVADNWVMERRGLLERARVLELENIALRTALQRAGSPRPVPQMGYVGANVTLRYPNAWWKEVRIDSGSSGGVVAGAPAMSDGFMVGRVSRVGENYAWVELVTSSTFLLAAVVTDTWDLGVINGDDNGNIWLMYMPPDKEFTKGMLVSTALVGDYLPPGIPVGMVWGPGEIRDGLMPLRVASGARLTQLYSVQILLSGAPGSQGGGL